MTFWQAFWLGVGVVFAVFLFLVLLVMLHDLCQWIYRKLEARQKKDIAPATDVDSKRVEV